jgi:hypothetical protein
MSAVHTIIALLLQAYGATAAFMPDLPLEVLSLTPVSRRSYHMLCCQTHLRHALVLQEARSTLSGRDAITVTFSRAVIALGSDFANELPSDKLPFLFGGTITVPGKFRWVTTFSARFDPDEDWPTDLSLDVQVNPALSSWDGVTVQSTEIRQFSTPRLTMSVTSVTSATATEQTDGMWTAGWDVREVPPDGVISLEFSHAVTPALMQQALQLRHADAKSTQVPVPSLAVNACTAGGSAATCVAVTLDGPLAVGLTYDFLLPLGSQYHAACGVTQEDATSQIQGLFEFKFNFAQTTIPAWGGLSPSQPQWDLWLRHGLSDDMTAQDVLGREKEIGGSGGSDEPPGPLLTHLHTVYMAYSEYHPTRLNPLAERTCSSQVLGAISLTGSGSTALIATRPRKGVLRLAPAPGQVRKPPSWPRSWAGFSLLQLYFHRNAWANLHLLGQPNALLARRPSAPTRSTRSPSRRPTTSPTASASPCGPA